MSILDKLMDIIYSEEEEFEELEEKKPLDADGKEKKDSRFAFFKPKKVEETAPAAVEAKEAPKAEAPVAKAAAEPKPARKPVFNFRANKNEKLTEFNARTVNVPVENKDIKVIVLEPVDFEDSQKIADYLRGSQPVVVNFSKTDNIIAKRMSDYISGTIYALHGSMKKMGRDILVCAPKNVDIDAGTELYDERGEQPWKH